MSLNLTRPLLLAGDFHYGPIVDGVRKELYPSFEVDKLTLTPSAETVEQKSKGTTTYGQTRSSIILPGDTTLDIAPMDLPAEVMAMIMLGGVTDLSQTSGSVTDEPVTGVLDRWVDLPHRQIGTIGGANVAAGLAPLTKDVDYKINHAAGMYMALTAQAAAPVLLDYDYAAIAGKSVSINTHTNVNRWVRLVGRNLHDDRPILMECYRVKLRPTGGMDLMANQHVVGALQGKLEQSLDPRDNSAVGIIHYLDAA